MNTIFTYAKLRDDALRAGLECCGGFHPQPQDDVPGMQGGSSVATLVLLGFRGPACWPVFSASAEFGDGLPDALDRWSRRVIDGLAERYGALGAYPFSGPPWWPFQRWAMRAEGLRPSPLGILMHPEYGLWHSYRGALLFATRLELPDRAPPAHPCDTCSARPCLQTCPVGAVKPDGYEAERCRDFVRSAGHDCRTGGCLARRSCPVGAAHRQTAEAASFHMAAFAGLQRPGR